MNKYDLVKRLRKNCGLTEAEVEKLIKAKLGEMSSSEREIAERLLGFVRNGRLDEFV